MALHDVKADPKPAARVKRREKGNTDAASAFRARVLSKPCIGLVDPRHVCETPLQAAHVVPAQVLRRLGLAEMVYEPRNAVPACKRLHERHDLCVEKIPRAWLPADCLHWAEENGLSHELERYWPVMVTDGTPASSARLPDSDSRLS